MPEGTIYRQDAEQCYREVNRGGMGRKWSLRKKLRVGCGQGKGRNKIPSKVGGGFMGNPRAEGLAMSLLVQ